MATKKTAAGAEMLAARVSLVASSADGQQVLGQQVLGKG
jgi:hypothetical protein